MSKRKADEQSFTVNKPMIMGFVLFIMGALFMVNGLSLQQSSCWGHLGCNYYTRSFDARWYSGMIFVAAGGYLIINSLLLNMIKSRKIFFMIKVLFVLTIVVLGLVVPLIVPATVFVW